MKKQLLLLALVILGLGFLLHKLRDRSSTLNHQLRHHLGVKTLLEFLNDYELDRGDRIPTELPECAVNITNKAFYFDHHGA